MSDEQQADGEGKRLLYFQDATAGIPTMKQQAGWDESAKADWAKQQAEQQEAQKAQERIEAFGKDLQSVIEKHNADMHFCATDADILAEYVLSVIAVFKFASQSRDYRLYQRMAKASAAGKLDNLNPA